MSACEDIGYHDDPAAELQRWVQYSSVDNVEPTAVKIRHSGVQLVIMDLCGGPGSALHSLGL